LKKRKKVVDKSLSGWYLIKAVAEDSGSEKAEADLD
jgi:hypothetical protein